MLSRDTLPGLCYTNNPPLGTKHHRLMSAPSPRDICGGQDISIASQSEPHPDNLTFNFLCIAQHIVIHSPVAKFLWNQYNNNTQAQVDNSSINTISEFNRQHEYVKYYTIFRASFPMIDGWYQPLVCTWPTIISSVTWTSWPRIPADVPRQREMSVTMLVTLILVQTSFVSPPLCHKVRGLNDPMMMIMSGALKMSW